MTARPLLALGAALAVLAAACDGATTPGAGDLGEMPADQIAIDVRHVMTEEGVRKAVLHADTAYLYQGTSEADMTGVRLRFFDEAGREAGELTSRTGNFDMRGNRMVARGDVVLVIRDERGEPRRIETEELHYDIPADRIWSDVETSMYHQGRTLRGTSFESDIQFQNVRIREARTEGGAPAPQTRPSPRVGPDAPPERPAATPDAEDELPPLEAPDTAAIR
jgi:LPS export ABC transporter protein LptC